MRVFTIAAVVMALAAVACRTSRADRSLRPVVAEPMPRYPEMARLANLHGVVELEFPVSAAGAVSGAPRIIESTHDLFLATVRVAVQRWQFRSTHNGGGPRADTVRLRFVFALDSSSRCGPAEVRVNAGERDSMWLPSAPPVVRFDTAALHGTVTACRTPRRRVIIH